VAAGVIVGNAEREAIENRGWLLGHFGSGEHHSEAVEVKWGVHALHETRERWAASAEATTLSILVRGQIRIYFRDREALLAEPGDYALWGPRVEHRWRVEADNTVVLTARWPSRAGDAIDL
jgi:hypothetical protein